MDRYREKTSTFFTRLAYGLGRKQRPTIVPLSKPLAPQTSLSTSSRFSYLDRMFTVNLSCLVFAVFDLPDELILSILSHASPDQQLAGYYGRFRAQYCMKINDHHEQRVGFLLSLSMTCRAMRLRLLPWVWERIKCLKLVPYWHSEGAFPGGANTITDALRANMFLATCVKCFCALLCMHLGRS